MVVHSFINSLGILRSLSCGTPSQPRVKRRPLRPRPAGQGGKAARRVPKSEPALGSSPRCLDSPPGLARPPAVECVSAMCHRPRLWENAAPLTSQQLARARPPGSRETGAARPGGRPGPLPSARRLSAHTPALPATRGRGATRSEPPSAPFPCPCWPSVSSCSTKPALATERPCSDRSQAVTSFGEGPGNRGLGRALASLGLCDGSSLVPASSEQDVPLCLPLPWELGKNLVPSCGVNLSSSPRVRVTCI